MKTNTIQAQNYFYIDKVALDHLYLLGDGESAVLKKFDNNLGITALLKGNQYLLKISYIKGEKVTRDYKFDFTELRNTYYKN